MNCEEKMVMFQLFVLECYKVQETLQKTCEVKDDLQIKHEISTNIIGDPVIKSEIVAIKSEQILRQYKMCSNRKRALNNEQRLASEIFMYGNDNSDADYHDDGHGDDDLDDVTIATLKQIKTNQIKRLTEHSIDTDALNKILHSPSFKVKDLVKFDCIFCKDKLKTWSNLQVHYTKRHKSEPVVLCLCGFEIRSKSVLYKHVSDHKLESKKSRKDNASEEDNQEDIKYSILNVKNFVKCDKCPKVSKSLAALNKHKMRHVPKSERKFCCSGCDKIFNTKDALKSHERSHIPIENRKIYHCDISTTSPSSATSALSRKFTASHKKVVHGKVKAYICDLCGTNGELRQHRAIHSADKPFVCNKCSKSFKTYSNLKTHMDTHEDTAYECYVCRRVLNSRRTLRKHLLVHEDKCRHICSYCNKAFKRRQTLKVRI
ncbi:putative zinc finger protein [Operophtera brumata]|uniref:Putative zinc finger protein n=1 Tax=Operophtera brumata TaxID=104452 RepID=A0A0L7LVG9_OPEBR|nr:putative zinc finger protein [Operophtera brumata]